jgi:hypothetical protein
MRYETIEHLKDNDFKRLTGVQRETFELMLKVVEKGMRNFGRPTKLSRADQLLLTLMYWREYRTEFHIAQSYGISEATVCRTIRKVENALVRLGKFQLPGKKVLQASDTVFEVVLVDASEQPIERPKKAKNGITVAKRSDTPKKRRYLLTEKALKLSPRLLVMEASTIFNCSRKMAVISPNTFVSWRMLATKVWRNFTKTARRLSRNPSITL